MTNGEWRMANDGEVCPSLNLSILFHRKAFLTPHGILMLGVIDAPLHGITKSSASVLKESDRVQYFLSMKNQALDAGDQKTDARAAGARAEPRASFSRKDYLQVFKTLSTATASRDLNAAVKGGVIKKIGSVNQTRYEALK